MVHAIFLEKKIQSAGMRKKRTKHLLTGGRTSKHSKKDRNSQQKSRYCIEQIN